MADGTKIEWTNETLNPIRARRFVALPDADPGDLGEERIGWHCEHKSPGCVNCYAEKHNLAGRSIFTGTRLPYKPGHRKDVEIFLDEKVLAKPLTWRRPRMIFVCSMTDLFADFVTDEMLDRVFAMMALCPQHTFQLLTKRADRMRAYCSQLPERIASWACDSGLDFVTPPIRNVWLGVSVEDQRRADERREDFRATPAAVKFVSYEPALGPVDWSGWEFVNQIISGGESGPRARPTHPDWHRATRDFCARRGIAYFFKQWGEYRPSPLGTERRLVNVRRDGRWEPSVGQYGVNEELMSRVGKKAAGRLLDGVEHNGMPTSPLGGCSHQS
jgi:protein gp37